MPPPPPPPIYFLPPTVFFWEEEVAFFARKIVEICDFRQKKPSDFGEDLFFFRRSPAFGRKKTLKFWPEKAFENRRKPLPPPILILPPPPISQSSRRP